MTYIGEEPCPQRVSAQANNEKQNSTQGLLCLTAIYFKVQPMMVQPPILSEDTKKREMGELLGML